MAKETYQIRYANQAARDIKEFRAFDQSKVLDGIEQHLEHEPTRVSRSRIKRMFQPFWSQYRLRIDDFRVYYDVNESQCVVDVLRILKKGSGVTPEESS